MERRADEAERETIKLKKVQYMENHIGETFAGVISGVAEYGFFVELENTVEGLVRVTSLTDDFYQYYEETYELVGEATNRRFKLGQQVRVTVDNCDRICGRLILHLQILTKIDGILKIFKIKAAVYCILQENHIH